MKNQSFFSVAGLSDVLLRYFTRHLILESEKAIRQTPSIRALAIILSSGSGYVWR